MERRCLGGGFFDGDSSLNRRFGLLLPKAVQLTGIQPAQQGRDLIPAKIQHGQPLFVSIQHFQLDAFGRGAVVGGIAGLQLHRLHDAGEGPAQPLCDLAVGLAGVQQLGKLRLVRRADQAWTSTSRRSWSAVSGFTGKNSLIASLWASARKQRLEPLPALGPVDGVRHAGGQQLNRIFP